MKISEWGNFLTDEQVNASIEKFFERPIIASNPINSREMLALYTKIVNNKDINNRSKLFYLDQLEDLIINSRITTTEDLIRHKDSLF